MAQNLRCCRPHFLQPPTGPAITSSNFIIFVEFEQFVCFGRSAAVALGNAEALGPNDLKVEELFGKQKYANRLAILRLN